MTSVDAPRVGYTHTTNLHDLSNASVSIQSQDLPLELRTVTHSDAPALLRIFSDERNVKHDPSAAGLNTLPAIERVITAWTRLTDPLSRLNLVIVTHGEVVGVGGMGHIYTNEHGNRIGDAGVMVNPDQRGKGFAYEAMRMTIDYALRILGLDEVTVGMGEANVEMRGLMDKRFRVTPFIFTSGKTGTEHLYCFKMDTWVEGR